MTSLKVLLIILVFQGSYSQLSKPFSNIKTSVLKTKSDLSLNNILKSLKITEDGVLDLDRLIKKLNLNENVKNIFDSLNVTVSNEGFIDLNSLVSNLDPTDHDTISAVLRGLDVKISDGVFDFKSLIIKLSNINLTDENLERVKTSEDGNLDFIGLARKYNLSVEAYNVTTEDGYILTVFHIPGNGSSVLCSHGILDTSDTFLMRGNISLVYILAQKSYDVWAMNYRGNRYSRSHRTLDPDTDKVYWEFSMQEKGYYDLAATIDFVLENTGRDQLSVIGHSEGTATVFILTSTKPEYNKKIKLFIALSPVCYLSDSGFAIRAGVRLWPILNKLLLATGVEELLGYDTLSRKLFQMLCSQGTVGYDVCYKVLIGAVFGYDPDNLEQDFWYTVLGHYPAGGSRKEVDHYVQIGQSNVFGQYDYGYKNSKVYGSKTPPIYDLKKVTCKVSLIQGKNDKILGQKAVKRLQRKLPNVVEYYLVEYELFNHVDFVYGRNAHRYVYQHLIELLISYT